MRIGLVSDLHLEFHADRGKALIASLDPTGVDVLVVAGDLATVDYLAAGLRDLCERFAQVVYVLGNHEFYGTSFAEVRAEVAAISDRHANLHVLDNSLIELGGRRFVGTTLWFRPQADDRYFARWMSDFTAIDDFARLEADENWRARDFLTATVRAGDVVVTHHLPTWHSVVPKYARHVLTRFFLCDVEPLLRERQPVLWVHGHTHETVDVVVGDTRIVCHPFGYPDEIQRKSRYRVALLDV